MQDMELEPVGKRRRPHVPRHDFGSRRGGVYEQGHDGCRGDQLMKQFQPLRSYFHIQNTYAGEIAAWSA